MWFIKRYFLFSCINCNRFICISLNLNETYINMERMYPLSQSAFKVAGLLRTCLPTSMGRLPNYWNSQEMYDMSSHTHKGIVSNEYADELARRGAASNFTSPVPYCGALYFSTSPFGLCFSLNTHLQDTNLW